MSDKSKFSSVISITDLNDFISPSQECIKPAQSVVSLAPSQELGSGLRIKYEPGENNEQGSYYQVDSEGIQEKLVPAKITLNDCLACSGCITSAESILVNQQTSNELYNILKSNILNPSDKKIVVITISPQTRASFAKKYNLSLVQTARKFVYFLKSLSIDYVFDSSFSRDLTLMASLKEFIQRYKNKELPLITSACPGWICYAEKTHPFILDKISQVRSPQQMMGSIVKQHFAKNVLKVPLDQIYHVTIMPCYDKKLEASRDDFYSDLYKSKDVDCVLTTGELESMVLESFGDFNNLGELPVDLLYNNVQADSHDQESQILGTEGSGAGGYLEYILKSSAFILFGKSVSLEDFQVKTLRNKDFKEYTVLDSQGKELLRFASAYGFRNIQNIIRKTKANSNPYDYVEIMACPSACLNGGGQLKYGASDSSDLDSLYKSTPVRDPDQNSALVELMQDWLGREGLEGDEARIHLYTKYHAMLSSNSNISSSW